jgi:hypothetical protein
MGQFGCRRVDAPHGVNDDLTQIYFGNVADQVFVKERPNEMGISTETVR